RLIADLERLNGSYRKKHGRVAFTSIDGRAKTEHSSFKKLYKLASSRPPSTAITKDTLTELHSRIRDVAGVRFSCPYYDEVRSAINAIIRPHLANLGYASDLQAEPGCSDKNYLDQGDDTGYRSYHFFVRIPTPVDIYGESELCLCEVQARTELQHIWAVKSHDLLYKPDNGWSFGDPHVMEDMRQLSNNLRAADQALISIRDRTRGEASK
ncbi:MAG: hypothetical protein IH986_14980, partial [Planctomycetes bacterium]|nr:hypothetical protein [Planctomycetota bacterium]